MTTSHESESGDGAPFLPPPSASRLPSPSLPAPPPAAPGSVPFLPSAPRPEPAPAPQPTSEFDARAMVDATKRKVENPVYGHIPTGTPEGRAAIDAARAKRRKRRQRNRMLGWLMAMVFLAVIGTAAVLAYLAFQDEGNDDVGTDATGDAAAVDGTAPLALTPLGEQVAIIEIQDNLNAGVAASAGGYLDAIDDAQAAVDQANQYAAPPATDKPPATLPSLACTSGDEWVFHTSLPTCDQAVAKGRELALAAGFSDQLESDLGDTAYVSLCLVVQGTEPKITTTPGAYELAAALVTTGVCPGNLALLTPA